MEEIPYYGEPTIGVAPPTIDEAENIIVPVAFPTALLGNKGTTGITNSTFELYCTTNVPANTNKVMMLHQGTNANAALVVIEPAEGASPNGVLARFWQDGTFPTPENGLPLKAFGVYEIIGTLNIRNFRIITADDLPHKVQVQYLQ